jgi:hypothetical protein
MKRVLLIICCICLFQGAEAQFRWDWGVHLGASNYLGDIGGTDRARRDFIYDLKLNQTSFVFGGHIRYRASQKIAITTTFMFGKVQGYDKETEYGPRRARNLNFRNNIKELSIRGEYTLFADNDVGGRGYYDPEFRAYGFVGIAVVMHNPQGYLNANSFDLAQDWYDLRPLKTEGQANEYETFTYAIPLGIGAYFTFQKKYRIGWELGYRVSGSDNLDDISGNYATNDQLSSDLSIALANQTTPEVILEAFGDPLEIYNYHYTADARDGGTNVRGIENNNDGYIFSTFSAGMLLKEKSRYSKAKYNWYKNRKRKKKARAKF